MDIKRPPKWRRILRRVVGAGAILLVGAIAAGLLTQYRRDARVRAMSPPPGAFADLGGYRVHYRLSGNGEFTFILEAGLGDYSASWKPIEEQLGALERVFVYDRAGLGWSESSPHPRTPEFITTELHETLLTAHIPGPYILVGHSMGGATQTLYALRYPDAVAGLLLIDPSHKDQFTRLPPLPKFPIFLMTVLPRAARFGLPQLFMGGSDPVALQTRHVATAGAEMRAFLHVAERWGDHPINFGDRPIYVLTAGDYSHAPGKTEAERRAAWETLNALHEELVNASTSSIRDHRVVEGATHYIHHTKPQAVLDAARDLVERMTRAKSAPP